MNVTPTAIGGPTQGLAMTPEEYERIALADPERVWELHRGRLREKPPMSLGHEVILWALDHQFQVQLDVTRFIVSSGRGRVARALSASYFVPDLFVIPREQLSALLQDPDALQALAVLREPLPFVVEVWSPATGDYDVDEKLPEYKARGDREIWILHPFARTVTAWRRRDDGDDDRLEFSGGVVELLALPGVSIDLDALFAPGVGRAP